MKTSQKSKQSVTSDLPSLSDELGIHTCIDEVPHIVILMITQTVAYIGHTSCLRHKDKNPPKLGILFDMDQPKWGIRFVMDPQKWGILFRMVPSNVSYSICSHYISSIRDL